MASGPFVNAVIDKNGTLPGASSGNAGDLPDTGMVIGDIFFSIDENLIYQWQGTLLGWVIIINGGSGVVGVITPNHIPYCNIVPGQLNDSNFSIEQQTLVSQALKGNANQYLKIAGPNQLGFKVTTIVGLAGNITYFDMLLKCNTSAGIVVLTTVNANMYVGQMFTIKITTGAGNVKINAGGGALIDGAASYTFSNPLGQKGRCIIQWDGTAFWVISNS
jgi:hypothetical protein